MNLTECMCGCGAARPDPGHDMCAGGWLVLLATKPSGETGAGAFATPQCLERYVGKVPSLPALPVTYDMVN